MKRGVCVVKNIFLKELILLDFKANKFRFYNIEINRLSYNELQVVFHSGKLATKGTKTVKNTHSYEEAMALAYKKFYEIKVKSYKEKEDLMGWLGQTNVKDKESTSNKKKNASNKNSNKSLKSKKYICDMCNKAIKPDIYDEINKWGRGGGGWDKNPDTLTYQNVLCIDCQWKHGIFKKRL
jgi:predicted DNA-binding WGR domain protein